MALTMISLCRLTSTPSFMLCSTVVLGDTEGSLGWGTVRTPPAPEVSRGQSCQPLGSQQPPAASSCSNTKFLAHH